MTTRRYFLLVIMFISCTGRRTADPSQLPVTKPLPTTSASEVNEIRSTNPQAVIDQHIRSILQDSHGAYWFGTNDSGVYRYDEKGVTHFTTADGLSNNQVNSIQEDGQGTIWFGTGGFGVSSYDGRKITSLAANENPQQKKNAEAQWKKTPNDLWFCAGDGVFRYDGTSLGYLSFANAGFGSTRAPHQLSRYAVYTILKDKKGNVWFGTQSQGVCRFDGKAFTWFAEKGLSGSAVLGIFEARNGDLWFGNNGAGLFRYDGKTVINFTEEKGLGNPEFKRSGKSGPGTLARIYAINEDDDGNLWIGTVDAGVWKYDGNALKNYTTNDGLTSNSINTIYKDRNGKLWFGTDESGVCTFDGRRFKSM